MTKEIQCCMIIVKWTPPKFGEEHSVSMVVISDWKVTYSESSQYYRSDNEKYNTSKTWVSCIFFSHVNPTIKFAQNNQPLDFWSHLPVSCCQKSWLCLPISLNRRLWEWNNHNYHCHKHKLWSGLPQKGNCIATKWWHHQKHKGAWLHSKWEHLRWWWH